MPETLDQIFVQLKHWIVGFFPEFLQPLISIQLSIVGILIAFPTLFAITTLVERKGLGRIQNRLGPNRVGFFGILQPAADGIKALIKEDVVPLRADKIVHYLAPIVLMLPAMLAYAVLPVGRNMAAIELDAGLLFFFCIGATAEIAIFMAGWASHNKYSLLGSFRAIAQMISYELPLIISSVTVVMMVGSLSLVDIVEAQSGYSGILPQWFVLTPWGFAGFILFMISAAAEANRSPFDLPEAESELVAGYFTEYSGFKFALFFLGEYLGLFAISGLGITLFLGGWNAPFSFLTWMPSWFWFFAKLVTLIIIFIWVRGTLPRLRVDQLMSFAWKFMLPMALFNLVIAAIWSYSANVGLWLQWLLCAALTVGAYLTFAKLYVQARPNPKRVYRFAD